MVSACPIRALGDGVRAVLVLALLQAQAYGAGLIAWDVNVGFMICRGHRYATGVRRNGVERQKPPGEAAAQSDGHGLGGSQGGFTTKICPVREQGQKLLSLLAAAGQWGDGPRFEVVVLVRCHR
ncbi:hypothetical protein [Streptomyces asiaticus]